MKLELIEERRGVRFELDIQTDRIMLDVAKVAESLHKDKQPQVWMNKRSTPEFLDLTCKQMGCKPDRLVHEIHKLDGSVELWLDAFAATEYLRWASDYLTNWFTERINELINDGTISCE